MAPKSPNWEHLVYIDIKIYFKLYTWKLNFQDKLNFSFSNGLVYIYNIKMVLNNSSIISPSRMTSHSTACWVGVLRYAPGPRMMFTHRWCMNYVLLHNKLPTKLVTSDNIYCLAATMVRTLEAVWLDPLAGSLTRLPSMCWPESALIGYLKVGQLTSLEWMNKENHRECEQGGSDHLL